MCFDWSSSFIEFKYLILDSFHLSSFVLNNLCLSTPVPLHCLYSMCLSTCACPLCLFTISVYCNCPMCLFKDFFTTVCSLLLSIDSVNVWPFTMSILCVCSMSLFSESVQNDSIDCVRSLFIYTFSVCCACQLGPFTASCPFFLSVYYAC